MDGDDETAAIVEVKAVDSVSQPQQLMTIDGDDSKIYDKDSVIIESEHQKSNESTKLQPQMSMLAEKEQTTQRPPNKPAVLPDPSPEQRLSSPAWLVPGTGSKRSLLSNKADPS